MKMVNEGDGPTGRRVWSGRLVTATARAAPCLSCTTDLQKAIQMAWDTVNVEEDVRLWAVCSDIRVSYTYAPLSNGTAQREEAFDVRRAERQSPQSGVCERGESQVRFVLKRPGPWTITNDKKGKKNYFNY